jgi:serine/threonine protein kinase
MPIAAVRSDGTCDRLPVRALTPPILGVPSSLLQRRRRVSEPLILLADATVKSAASRRHEFDAKISEEYAVLDTIGRGACGVVQRAVRRSDGVQVALKRLASSAEPEAINAARSEFEILRCLRHPNIVCAFDLVVSDSCAATVMELAQGQRLQDAVRKAPGGRLSPEVVCSLAAGLTQGLSYLHKSSVLHQDLKPANVMVASDCKAVKIVDFNCALCPKVNQERFETATPLFAAPEQLLGAEPTELCDVWSGGMCLHFAMTGALPQGRDSCETLDSLECAARREVDLSGRIWEQASGSCLSFFRRCLALDAGCRASARQLTDEPWLRERQADSVGELDDSDISSKDTCFGRGVTC